MMNTNERAMHRFNAITATVFPGQMQNTLAANTCASHFDKVFVPKPDKIFHTKSLFAKDTDRRKINLSVGAYRTDSGKPLVLNVVRKAQIALANDRSLNREYLPITGDAEFATAAAELMLGADSKALNSGLVASAQTLSGTGALRVAGEFCTMFLPGAKLYISDPTWGNHKAVFNKCGISHTSYRYWSPENRNLDINGMLADLSAAPAGSIVLLHVAAHNPTGVDPTQAQWHEIAKVCQTQGLFPFFDCAYQGFASGDLAKDAYAPRLFADMGMEFLICQSFAKNLGLYNARVGALHFVTLTQDKAKAVKQQIAKIVRPMYSNPPSDGARIVKMILKDPALFKEWDAELKGMSHRIIEMRALLRSTLERLGAKGDWSHITSQIGMFTYTGLNPAQCAVLVQKHHVYLLDSGRISMAGVNSKNVEYLAAAIAAVC